MNTQTVVSCIRCSHSFVLSLIIVWLCGRCESNSARAHSMNILPYNPYIKLLCPRTSHEFNDKNRLQSKIWSNFLLSINLRAGTMFLGMVSFCNYLSTQFNDWFFKWHAIQECKIHSFTTTLSMLDSNIKWYHNRYLDSKIYWSEHDFIESIWYYYKRIYIQI